MWRAILPTLLSLTPYQADQEPPEARAERMEVIAKAIDYAASRATCGGAYAEDLSCVRLYPGSRTELASMLVGLGYMESGFSLHVHDGRCGPRECDAITFRDRDGRLRTIHRARSSWQVHFNHRLHEVWEDMAGTSQWQTCNAAWAATIVLSGAKARCRTRLGALSGYAGVQGCTYSNGPKRLAFIDRMEAKIRAGGPTPKPVPERVAVAD